MGVDGCRVGWVAVNMMDEGFEVELFKSFEEICSKYSDSDSILVDMPIGLPESIEDIRPDAEARSYLPRRTSCFCNTPCRQSVYTEDYFEENTITLNEMIAALERYDITAERKSIYDDIEALRHYGIDIATRKITINHKTYTTSSSATLSQSPAPCHGFNSPF